MWKEVYRYRERRGENRDPKRPDRRKEKNINNTGP
jgi:hypothetical protein